jgi:threonylcarbamoyladenosine tRNA methylthiotransferase MtaB
MNIMEIRFGECFHYEEKVDAITKKERADKLEKLRDLMYENKRNNYIGKKMKVLVEEIKHKKAYGYTENYIKVQINNYEGSINNIVEVEIKELLRGMLVGD